jgi:hypothetical protein
MTSLRMSDVVIEPAVFVGREHAVCEIRFLFSL